MNQSSILILSQDTQLLVDSLHPVRKLALFITFLISALILLIKCFIMPIQDFSQIWIFQRRFELLQFQPPYLSLLLRHIFILLVSKSRLRRGSLLLPLEDLRDFELSPNKVAVGSAFIHDGPPKSTLDQALDHGSIVACSNIGLPLLRPVNNVIEFQVQIDVDIMTEHVLP